MVLRGLLSNMFLSLRCLLMISIGYHLFRRSRRSMEHARERATTGTTGHGDDQPHVVRPSKRQLQCKKELLHTVRERSGESRRDWRATALG